MARHSYDPASYHTIRVAPSVEARFANLILKLKAKLQEPGRLTRHGLSRYLFMRGLDQEEQRLIGAAVVPPEMLR